MQGKRVLMSSNQLVYVVKGIFQSLDMIAFVHIEDKIFPVTNSASHMSKIPAQLKSHISSSGLQSISYVLENRNFFTPP